MAPFVITASGARGQAKLALRQTLALRTQATAALADIQADITTLGGAVTAAQQKAILLGVLQRQAKIIQILARVVINGG